MNKPELEALIDSLKKDNNNLMRQAKDMRTLAESAGSETAKWKHQALRQEEEILKLKSELSRYEEKKNGKKPK